jgi:hypothetical protein
LLRRAGEVRADREKERSRDRDGDRGAKPVGCLTDPPQYGIFISEIIHDGRRTSMKKVLVCILAVLMFAAVIGCGSKGSGSASIEGTWKLTKANVSGIEVSAEQMGQSMSFTFNGDGSATMTANGETTPGISWKMSGSTVTLGVGDRDLYELTYDGSTLTLVEPNSGVTLVFER